MKMIQPSLDIAIVLVFGIAFSVIGSRVGVAIDSNIHGTKSMKQATRAGGAAESKTDAWYPRTEKVAAYETIVVALGNGMPTPITRAQKSSAGYVELGNGDTFLFDCGTGSAENLFALHPDMARVNKVFASHLHTDHVGDVDALWTGGRRDVSDIDGPAFEEFLKKDGLSDN